MTTDRSIEGRIKYSKDALTTIMNLSNEDPFGKTSITKIVGSLKLGKEGEYLRVNYIGKEDIAKRLETYMNMANRTDEAMMAVFGSNSKEIN